MRRNRPLRFLITAGPTREYIDPVRFISNDSSGKMGFALAAAAKGRGHRVMLVHGPVAIQPARGVRTLSVLSAAEMLAACRQQWPRQNILIMAAAVADYRPAHPEGPSRKHSRQAGTWTLGLEPTPDLLAQAAASRRPNQITVGFALEPTDRLLASARAKLVDKDIDAIVANPLQTIGADHIRATLLLRDGRELTPPQGECTKREFAQWLLDRIEEL